MNYYLCLQICNLFMHFIFFSYSPEYLVQEGVVVVTCNYRLGPFGFLCLPEAGIQGNAGIKDQVIYYMGFC